MLDLPHFIIVTRNEKFLPLPELFPRLCIVCGYISCYIKWFWHSLVIFLYDCWCWMSEASTILLFKDLAGVAWERCRALSQKNPFCYFIYLLSCVICSILFKYRLLIFLHKEKITPTRRYLPYLANIGDCCLFTTYIFCNLMTKFKSVTLFLLLLNSLVSKGGSSFGKLNTT